MKIVLAGGSGFLGQPLRRALTERGHDVVVLSRNPARLLDGRGVPWNPDGTAGPRSAAWPREVDGAHAVINLSGESIGAGRWTTRRRAVLHDSRILSTRSLVSAVRLAAHRPTVFISASGVNYYGATGDVLLDESCPPGSDFLATLCVEWEAEARAAEALGCRVVILRSGIVLAGNGGVLTQLALPFRLFAGGPVASGRQVRFLDSP